MVVAKLGRERGARTDMFVRDHARVPDAVQRASGAPQSRDLHKRGACDDPGSAAQHLRAALRPGNVNTAGEGADDLMRKAENFTPEDFQKRFDAAAQAAQREYCDIFEFWRACRLKSCRRSKACGRPAALSQARLCTGTARTPRSRPGARHRGNRRRRRPADQIGSPDEPAELLSMAAARAVVP